MHNNKKMDLNIKKREMKTKKVNGVTSLDFFGEDFRRFFFPTVQHNFSI